MKCVLAHIYSQQSSAVGSGKQHLTEVPDCSRGEGAHLVELGVHLFLQTLCSCSKDSLVEVLLFKSSSSEAKHLGVN